MEKNYEFGVDLHLVFIDYKQSYDSIDRGELWKGLEILGVSGKYVNLMKMCSEKTVCKIRLLQIELFAVEIELRQRNTLSPTLFNLVLEKIVRDVNKQR